MPGLWRLGIAAVLLNALSTRGLAAVALCEDAVGRTFQAPPSEQVWLAEALMAACALSLPVTPWLRERLGQRRLLVLCTAGFLISSLGATTCGSLEALVGWLVVQGLSTAPLLPLTQAMLADGFPEARRPLAMALWNGGNVLGILLGSFGGGLALATGDWRHVFWLGWPLALGGLALAGEGPRPVRRPLDLPGFLLLGVGTASLALGLNLAPRLPAGDPLRLLLLLGPACLAGYGWHARSHPSPLLDLQPLLAPACRRALAFSFAFNTLCAGQLEINYLVSQMHLEPSEMTLRNLLVGLSSLAAVGLAGLPLPGLLAGSLLVSLVGKSGVLLYQPQSSFLVALWPSLVANLGYWMVVTVLSIAVLQGLDAGSRPAASALFALSGTLGNTLGLAVLDALFDRKSRLVSVSWAYSEVFWLEWVGVLALLLLALRSSAGQARRRPARTSPP